VVFVCPGLVDRAQRLPTYRMRASLLHLPNGDYTLPGDEMLSIHSATDRAEALERFRTVVKTLTAADVDTLVDALCALIPDRDWQELDDLYASEALLDWDGIRALADAGIEIGSHTLDHVILHPHQSPAEIERQARDARTRIEHELQRPCRLFSYPNGTPRDLSRANVASVGRSGYTHALTNVPGPANEGPDPLLVPRHYAHPTSPTWHDLVQVPSRVGELLPFARTGSD
jgi:hypothetical protein